ncbi:MAG: ATP-grasp domain-containing protein [Phycisphaerae bacterium]|nr:ATP-grasp domain-containing protein [Phycisphaerae bacterium]
MSKRCDDSGPLTLVFTCVGRRIELLQAFRAAARRLNVPLRLVGVDSDLTAPALSCVDEPVIVPRAFEAGYVPALLDAVRKHEAGALIPTTDTDLRIVSRHRDDIAQLDCVPMIATAAVINTCRDKVLTYEHLHRSGIDTPETYTPAQLQRLPAKRFPLFIKPRTGSASQLVHKIEDEIDLEYYLRRIPDPIIQEFIDGVEHTLDVYVGLTGVPRCVVPRARWQVRTGEVSKGVVVKDLEIMNAGKQLVETLGPSVRGIVTLQCIVTPERRIRFIEINPRFGGGVPLAIAAGADFPAWLLQELRGESPRIAFDGFRHGLCMLRYDWSVFVPLQPDLNPRLSTPLGDIPDFI